MVDSHLPRDDSVVLFTVRVASELVDGGDSGADWFCVGVVGAGLISWGTSLLLSWIEWLV